MDEEIKNRFVELENKIVSLQREIARLEAYVKDGEGGFDKYVTNHQEKHLEMSRMLWAAYAKTHPEFVTTLLKFDEILGRPKDDGGDPQP